MVEHGVEVLHRVRRPESPTTLGRELGGCHQILDLLDGPYQGHQDLLLVRLNLSRLDDTARSKGSHWPTYAMRPAVKCTYKQRQYVRRREDLESKIGGSRTLHHPRLHIGDPYEWRDPNSCDRWNSFVHGSICSVARVSDLQGWAPKLSPPPPPQIPHDCLCLIQSYHLSFRAWWFGDISFLAALDTTGYSCGSLTSQSTMTQSTPDRASALEMLAPGMHLP